MRHDTYVVMMCSLTLVTHVLNQYLVEAFLRQKLYYHICKPLNAFSKRHRGLFVVQEHYTLIGSVMGIIRQYLLRYSILIPGKCYILL